MKNDARLCVCATHLLIDRGLIDDQFFRARLLSFEMAQGLGSCRRSSLLYDDRPGANLALVPSIRPRKPSVQPLVYDRGFSFLLTALREKGDLSLQDLLCDSSGKWAKKKEASNRLDCTHSTI